MTQSTTTTKRTKGRKRIAILITSAVLVAAGAGTAVAYWTSLGNGSGTATTGTSTSFTVTTSTATGGPLTPGGLTQKVPFTIQNTGSSAQTLSTFTAKVANADDTPWTLVTGCSALDYAVSGATYTAADFTTLSTYTPGANTGAIAAAAKVYGYVTISMNNLTTNQDLCKNASVPLYFDAK